jgi:hypothetical protein
MIDLHSVHECVLDSLRHALVGCPHGSRWLDGVAEVRAWKRASADFVAWRIAKRIAKPGHGRKRAEHSCAA